MKLAILFLTAATALSALNGCGADDTNPNNVFPPTAPLGVGQTVAPKNLLIDQQSVKNNEASRGLFWAFSPLPPDWNKSVKCFLEDGIKTSQTQALGQAVMIGSVLGAIILWNGGHILGHADPHGKHHPQPNPDNSTTPTADRGLLGLYRRNVRPLWWGAAQGGALGLLCDKALVGIGIYPGILGANFEAASAAIYLGSLSAIATSPFLKYWIDKSEAESSGVIDRVRSALHRTEIGDWVTTRLGANLGLTFIGGGVAILTFYELQHSPDVLIPTNECAEPQKPIPPMNLSEGPSIPSVGK